MIFIHTLKKFYYLFELCLQKYICELSPFLPIITQAMSIFGEIHKYSLGWWLGNGFICIKMYEIVNVYLSVLSKYVIKYVDRVIKSTRFRWAGHVTIMEENRSTLKVLKRNSVGKRPLARPRGRAFVNATLNLRVP